MDDFARHAAHRITLVVGSWQVFVLALLLIAGWAMSGPIFGFSDTWQLVINTGTTIITFLMVFLIQRTQNKDSMAVQLKLNELIAAVQGASNRAMAIDDLSEKELKRLHDRYLNLAARKQDSESTSLEDDQSK